MASSNNTEKKKVGRPKKVQATPVVNEEEKKLRMEDSGDNFVTVEDLRRDLTSVYQKVYGYYAKEGVQGSIVDWNKYNPFLQEDRLRQTLTAQGKQLSKEDLYKAISNPDGSENALQGQSWQESFNQYLYYKMIRMSADVPLYKHYITPEYLEAKDYNSKDFKKEDKYVRKWVQTFDIVKTLKTTALEVKRAGKAAYLLRNSVDYEKGEVNYCTWQKLPDNFIKITGIGEKTYLVSLNMLLFLNPVFSLDYYPPYIRDIFDDMINKGVISPSEFGPNGNVVRYSLNSEEFYDYNNANGIKQIVRMGRKTDYMFWVQLPQEVCYVFSSDASHPWKIPDTTGLLGQLRELSDYATLAGLIASTPLTALLTGEIEPIADARPGANQSIFGIEEITGAVNNFNAITSTNVEALGLPLKNIKLQSLPSQPNSSDLVTKATQNVITMAGMGGLIAATDKPSVAQVKAAQYLEEAQEDYVTRQFESVLNYIINHFIGCKYEWKLHLWGGVFTFGDDVARMKEMWQGGATFLMPRIASAFDMDLHEVKATDAYIKSLNIYSDFVTVTQQTRVDTKENDNSLTKEKVGRPSKTESEIDNDNTAKSIDQGTNTGDMRDYVKMSLEKGKCVICGNDSDGILCEECAEKYMEV